MSAARHIPAWVDTIAPQDATGRLKEAYDWQSARLGEPTEYTRLGSLHAELVHERLRLYKVIEELASGLSELEKRAVMYLTSVLNATPHCASGARAQILALDVPDSVGNAEKLVDALRDDPRHPDTGDARLDALLAYTVTLTLDPGATSEADIERLRTHGLTDADIVAANNLAAYYAYTNRVATGLGLRTDVPEAHAHGAAPQ